MSVKRILAFRLSSLGDVALTVPVILAVLEQNSQVEVTLVTPKFHHDLFPEHHRLSLIDFDKKKKHKGILGLIKFYKSIDWDVYDAIADLHQVLRTQILSNLSRFHINKIETIDKKRKARKALIRGNHKFPLQHMTENYADVFRNLGLTVNLNFRLKNYLFETTTEKNGIGIAPFARHKGKMYPIEQMKIIVNDLSKFHKIYVFGSQKELELISDWSLNENVHLSQNLSLKDELKCIATLQLMISMDSANMHLASLVGVPVISLWGVTHPDAGFLGYGQHQDWVIQDTNLSWRPTSIYGKDLGPADNPNGFSQIKPEMVLRKINEYLELSYV